MSYDSLPDVNAYAKQFGATIDYTPPDVDTTSFKSFRDRRYLQDLGQGTARINGQLPYTAPQLLTSEQVRWQMGMVLVGGFSALLLYSYMFGRPLFA
jgi:hypothetical protein